MSNGNGCNFCIVLSEWNMVIVRMGTEPFPTHDRQARFDAFFRKLGEALTPLDRFVRPDNRVAVPAADRMNAD